MDCDFLLFMIGTTPYSFPRYRGVELENKNGKLCIEVRTRTGGNNRICDNDNPNFKCQCDGCFLQYHIPWNKYYIKDEDWDFDNTFSLIYYKIPKKYMDIVRKMYVNDDSWKKDSLYKEFLEK